MKIEVDKSTLKNVEFDIHEILNLAIILSGFMARCSDKESVEYSYLVGVICRQLSLINSKLKSILVNEEEKNSDH